MHRLQERAEDITRRYGGVWGITVEDLDTGARFELNGNELFNAASIIKLPIMAAAFAAAHDRELNLGERVVLEAEDFAGGSGVLQHLSPGLSFAVYDLIVLMIIQSDNAATNKVIDLVGAERIGRTMEELGMNRSKFHHKTGLNYPHPPGRNIVTSADTAALLKRLAEGSYLTRHACKRMIDILKKQQIRNGLPHELPAPDEGPVGRLPDWELAHKTGWVSGIQHDAGILYARGRSLVVTVLTRDAGEGRPARALAGIAELGRAAYEYAAGPG
ncbi:hypothetical protein J19TS2_47600 [Cohnella xylanilytica]|uniref:Serine hydrolase n=1 Tax=Cohnella xylanilytica TaxID=557555 RepID=A0A841U6S3_9BACL|nr:serine hydrolase [Cohnella xylanilytica]MBB6693690.1 serine hydrolase [Cohnella xylanilytica]GIO15205.1 hypothetical protein J19TS2_47600 [Cohnella xylanilytica]